MSGLNRASQKFLAEYEKQYFEAKEAARTIGELVREATQLTGTLVHAVSARAKTLESIRGKLRRKNYPDPKRQLTDIIGVRVITYYRDAVDPVVQKLQETFEINRRQSVDKRHALGLRNFGYRSVHLVAKTKSLRAKQNPILKDGWFEIQVRSILEHAWAEIEHEVVYKSGVALNDDVLRRFAALAGSLELFDGEFLALRNEKTTLVSDYVGRYRQNLDERVPFDVARLLGFLEVAFPDGRSWRRAEREGNPFAAGLDACCVDALRAAGLVTPISLKQHLRSKVFQNGIRTFAASEGASPSEISHLAIIVLAVATKNSTLLKRHFPEMMFNSTIKEIIEGRK